jgi:hypothetical protein
VKIDYRVDRGKLLFRCGPEGAPGLPIQCTARLHKPFKERFGFWRRTWLTLFGSSAEYAEAARAERCNGLLGHWEYVSQRFHCNNYGDEWGVTAEDAAPYNPDEKERT